MKYAIIKVINGNYFIHAEGISDVNSAKTIFHGLRGRGWFGGMSQAYYVYYVLYFYYYYIMMYSK